MVLHCFLYVCCFVFSTDAAALIYFYCLFRFFKCGALFCKIQDGSYFTLNSNSNQTINFVTYQYLHEWYALSNFITEEYHIY